MTPGSAEKKARPKIEHGVDMPRLFPRLATLAFILVSAASTPAQKVEFSADMQVLDYTGRTQIVKLSVGNLRARLDRTTGQENFDGLNSLLIDFDHKLLFLVIPQFKMYMRIAGSDGTPFYQGAWM